RLTQREFVNATGHHFRSRTNRVSAASIPATSPARAASSPSSFRSRRSSQRRPVTSSAARRLTLPDEPIGGDRRPRVFKGGRDRLRVAALLLYAFVALPALAAEQHPERTSEPPPDA